MNRPAAIEGARVQRAASRIVLDSSAETPFGKHGLRLYAPAVQWTTSILAQRPREDRARVFQPVYGLRLYASRKTYLSTPNAKSLSFATTSMSSKFKKNQSHTKNCNKHLQSLKMLPLTFFADGHLGNRKRRPRCLEMDYVRMNSKV